MHRYRKVLPDTTMPINDILLKGFCNMQNIKDETTWVNFFEALLISQKEIQLQLLKFTWMIKILIFLYFVIFTDKFQA
jgi:hypothetical protein